MGGATGPTDPNDPDDSPTITITDKTEIETALLSHINQHFREAYNTVAASPVATHKLCTMAETEQAKAILDGTYTAHPDLNKFN